MVYERESEPPEEDTVVVREWFDDDGEKTVELRLVAEPDYDQIRIERASGTEVAQSIRVETDDVGAMIEGLEALKPRLEG